MIYLTQESLHHRQGGIELVWFGLVYGVLLVEETGVPDENHRSVTSH